MKKEFRFVLDRSSKKFQCPSCNKKRFNRYIDINNNNYLPDRYGYCDRLNSCKYILNPYSDGFAKSITDGEKDNWIEIKYVHKTPKPRVPVYIPKSILEHTCANYQINEFLFNLKNNIPFPFPQSKIDEVVNLYQIGTIGKGYMKAATTLPFIDERDKIRAIQVKKFDNDNHTIATSSLPKMYLNHFKKSTSKAPQWVYDYDKNDTKFSCLFGANLLKRFPNTTVVLVEAAKTCIYGTLYFGPPSEQGGFLWLATYNLSSLNYDRCKVLSGRNVLLMPDLSSDGSSYDLWKSKADYFNSVMPTSNFRLWDFLEQNATEQQKAFGLDISDFLIELDWKGFTPPSGKQNSVLSSDNSKPETKTKKPQTTLDLLIQKNPNLQSFIDTFGLVQV